MRDLLAVRLRFGQRLAPGTGLFQPILAAARDAPAIAVLGGVGAVLAKVRAMPDFQDKQTTTATRTGSLSKRILDTG
jgi:hypothetical protein